MKVRLVEGLQLIITPENYVERVALSKWAETHQGAGGLLVESYVEHTLAPDVGVCTCENVDEANRGTWLVCMQCLKPQRR